MGLAWGLHEIDVVSSGSSPFFVPTKEPKDMDSCGAKYPAISMSTSRLRLFIMDCVLVDVN